MSRFFENFPVINYKFGNTNYGVDFQHLGTYIDIVDQVKEYNTFYQDYYISEFERPDAVSSKLYSNPNYAWTFFLLNDKLRIAGWPVDTPRVYTLAEQYYPNLVITTDGLLNLIGSSNEFLPITQSVNMVPGRYAYFESNNIVYKILKIDYDLGQIWLQPPPGRKTELENEDNQLKIVFILSSETDYDPVMENAWLNNNGQIDQVGDLVVTESILINEHYFEYDAPHHWEDTTNENEWVWPELKDVEEVRGDLPPEATADISLFNILDQNSFTNNPNYQSISYRGRLEGINNDLRNIKVIRPDAIASVSAEFNRLLRERI